ncbi:MAG TPA: hypothetical protein VHO48_01830 [Anaerolineaceae bacterium]|jgi:hypothetical protein|nr:hypothetical protein [Anaerolineaceae bacterium]
MQDRCTYQIELLGRLDVNELNLLSPQEMREVCTAPAATLLSVTTDQSGLIGLLRHLHGLGLVILSLTRQP